MTNVKVSSVEENGILWIQIDETEASIRISSKVHQKFDEYLSAGNKKIAIDMSKVDFIDSSFLGILVSAMKDADSKGISIALFTVRPNVKAIFDLTRLDKLIPILDNKDEVVRRFSS